MHFVIMFVQLVTRGASPRAGCTPVGRVLSPMVGYVEVLVLGQRVGVSKIAITWEAFKHDSGGHF